MGMKAVNHLVGRAEGDGALDSPRARRLLSFQLPLKWFTEVKINISLYIIWVGSLICYLLHVAGARMALSWAAYSGYYR